MRRHHLTQRVLSLLLALVITLSCAPAALAAESAKATTMQLQKTEGTVNVTNSSGKSVSARDNLRLYNGYHLETEEESYAWINLDDSKLIKMDAVSEISIRKSGKKLDVLVDSGNLFFDVSEPLEDDESMNIRTSTMVIGIRGTSGWVKVVDQWTTQAYILEGTVEASVTDPVTGETKTEAVKGGETVTCKVYPQDKDGSKCDIIRQAYREEDIEGFVLVELVKNRPLCEKILEDSGLDITGSGVDAERKLREDQEAVRNKLEQIKGQHETQENNISQDPVWTNPVPDGGQPPKSTGDTESTGSTGSGGGGSSSPTPVPTETITLTMPQTAATVNGYLSRDTVREVVLLPGTARSSTASLLDVDSALTVPSGKLLTLRTGVSLALLSGQTLSVQGKLTVDGECRLSGTLAGSTYGTIKAKSFLLPAKYDWKASDAADSAGFYTLIYSPQGAYTVSFNAMGGTVSPSSAVTGTDGRLTSLPIPTRAGYTFDGWFTAVEGGTQVTSSTVFTRNTTVHAHWTENAVTSGEGWKYDPAIKTLYITGSGPMKDYGGATTAEGSTVTNSPWERFRPEIVAVVISDGITSVGEYAFVECPKLASVDIPSSVTSVKGWAFSGSSGLKDVYYGDTEEAWGKISISSGNQPLLNASKHFKEPSVTGVTWRYDEATTTLYIEGSGRMEQIEGYAYSSTGITPWDSQSRSITRAVISSGVTTIADGAFIGCRNLTSVSIPDTVTRIGKEAFYTCSSLTSVTLPDGLTYIGSYAFQWCPLTTIVIPEGVTQINVNTFSDCKKMTSITIPSTVTSIQANSFMICESLTDVYYNDTKARWGAITIASSGTLELTSSTIHCTDGVIKGAPHTITFDPCGGTVSPTSAVTSKLGQLSSLPKPTRTGYTFNGWFTAATGGTQVFGSTAFTQDTTIYAQWTAENAEGVTWRIDGSTLYIEGSGPMEDYIPTVDATGYAPWFDQRLDIKSVVVGNQITRIGSSAFFDLRNATSIAIPGSVTSIGEKALQRCTSLKDIVIPNGVTTMEPNAFYGCSSLTSVTIPASVKSLGVSAFYLCDALTDIYYAGTEDQWIYVENISGAGIPTTATIHYNSTARSSVSYSALTGYTDVPAGAPYAEAVNFCKDSGLMLGTSDTTFSPNGTLTRAMMVTVLYRMAGKPAAAAPASFADVPAGKYYTEAVSWASSLGIVNGYDASTFGPNDPVTHQQVGLILQRYGGSAVQVAGADAPKAPATRAEVAMTLMDYARNHKSGALSETSAIDVMCAPSGIALDKDGGFIVTDVYGKQLWRVQNRNGTAFAGGATVLDLYGQPLGGYNDARLDSSYFKEPWAIAPFLDGWAVSDTANNVVRLVSGGNVRTLNGATREKLKTTSLGVAFNGPTGLASDDDGNLYVSDTLNGAVRRVTPKGGVSTVAKNLSEPTGLCWKDGVLYIAETGRNRIVRLADGKISTVAGSGTEGLTDGGAGKAMFSSPKGVAVGADGSIYVADTGNGAVRQIKGGTVTTLASRDPERPGGGLTSPVGLLVQGNSLYICDTFARKIFVYQLG